MDPAPLPLGDHGLQAGNDDNIHSEWSLVPFLFICFVVDHLCTGIVSFVTARGSWLSSSLMG